MTNLLRFLLVITIIGISGKAYAQGQSGAIQGEVLDGEGLPAINAVITVSDPTGVKGNTVTDFNGEYTIKPLNPGRYDVKVTLLGHKETVKTGVIVSPDKTTGVDFSLQKSESTTLEEVVIIEYKVPLIDKYAGGNTVTKTKEEIDRMPTRNTSTVASTSPGVYSAEDGDQINLGGGRNDGTLYIIDGVQVVGNRGINIPQGAIDQIQVLTSGISAKYGDAIGGVVTITTRGVSDKLRGNVLLERSVDGYGHNLANVSLSGPLFSKRIDSVNKKPVVGFALSGDVWYDEDRRPNYHGNYAVKDEVLQDLQANPIFNVPNQSGATIARSRAENVLAEDLYITKKRQNAAILEGRLNGSLDFQLADNLTLRAGGNVNYTKQNVWIRSLSYFAPEAQPIETNLTGRGYLRLQQSFKNPEPQESLDGMEPKKPLISNAFYTVQVDYQYDRREREHPDHGREPFKYGYVGKFNTQYLPIYGPSVDSVTGRTGTRLIVDRVPVATTFERSELNPILANYTTQYYNIIGDQLPQDVSVLRARGAMTNGQMPNSIYGIHNVMGQSQTSFFNADISQYSVSVDASFDLQPGKTRHSIEFGLYYQQRTERSYQVIAANTNGGLWQYMRQLTNTHIALDRENPIFIIDGQQYTKDQIGGVNGVTPSVTDTILYNRVSRGTQNVFDQNLRDRLGVGTTEYIDIDALDPSTFSLDLFSADELLNSGNPFVGYQGYDYLGNRQSGQVNFNDFFTKKDANGNFTRDIGAYRPNYLAAYILDKFQFKDIFFNVGLRVERFDANTKVLKDPYSLYEVNTLGDAKNITDATGNRLVQNRFTDDGSDPGNIGDDYVVYVDNNESGAPGIIGYRNGDDWYDPYGRLVQDPNTLKQYSGGRDPQPYLVDSKVRITDSTFDPNSSFTDYTPQINVMPRISFNFPISDQAMFYAHYDVLVQRPKARVYARPSDYYFLTANQGGLINNPDLKPEKLFDYEVGFKQTLSERSAVTISGFYKERKDMIQVRPYLFAWPTTYYTYGNRDFSTTKGMTVRYDMRRTGNLRLDVAYTLQYVNGTGSGDQSGVASATNPSSPGLLSGFISAGLPNIRTTFPLNIDTRHMIVSTIDYRYGEGEGPLVANSHIFQNMGANVIFRARSGEPYTKYTNPRTIANTVDGQVNGSRLPWHYMFDLKVDKDFKIAFGKKDDTKVSRPVYLNAYVLVTNLFNIRDVQQVDGYTSRPDDDGYLSSPQGIQVSNNQLNTQSYIDLYSANLMGIANTRINLPRRINVGLNLNF